MRIRKKMLIFYIIFAISSFLNATQTHYDGISLKELVNNSNYVLVVKRIKPFVTNKKISILPKNSIYKGKNDPPYFQPEYHDPVKRPIKNRNYPPYNLVYHNYKVIEVLKKSEFVQNEVLPKKIKIREGDFRRKLMLHKMYYLEGRRKSPIYRRYESSIEGLHKEKKLIVFVDKMEDEYEYSYQNAYESLKQKDKIKKILKGSQKKQVMCYNDQDLETIIDMSDYIVIAEKIKTTHKKVSFGKKYPSYRKTIYKFRIKEILSKRESDTFINPLGESNKKPIELKIGKKIKVLDSNFNQELSVHMKYYVNETMVSPIYQRYKTRVIELEDNKNYILFLNSGSEELSFVCEGSYEAIKKKEEIMKLLKKRKKL